MTSHKSDENSSIRSPQSEESTKYSLYETHKAGWFPPAMPVGEGRFDYPVEDSVSRQKADIFRC